MRFKILFILLLTVTTAGVAQYTSTPQGTFTVDQIRGCAPFTINLDAPTCDGSVGCDVDYEGNNVFQSVILASTHTYNTAGVYTIRLVRGAQIDNIQVEVFENTPPGIQVSSCGGNKVSVSVLDTNYDQYAIDYDDGTAEVTIPANSSNQHTYPSSGPRTISVRGKNFNSLDNCNSVSETVNVLQTLPTPVITTLEVIDNTSIRLAFNGQPNIRYKLEIAINNSSTFQQIKTLFGTTVDTVKNLKPDDNVYCFRIGAFDPCNNQTFYSNTICSANFDLTVLNNENVLTWTTSAGATAISSQQLEITPTNSGTSLTIANANSPYSDTNIICGTEYCYQLTIFYTNNSQSVSLTKCGTAISTDIPDPITNISAIVGDPGVNLQWLAETGFTPDTFSVFKSTDDTYNFLTKTAELTVDDELYTPESESCYKITYIDVCGNESDFSLEACPIVLAADLTSANEVVLNWSAYNGWTNGVASYLVDKYDENGTLLETIDVGAVTTYTDATQDLINQVYTYVVRAQANDAGVAQSVSNPVTIVKDPNLFYPTAFTPNGDSLNDIFNVFGQYISSFQMDIFNRWGELMYTTTDLEKGWDGKFKGIDMPEGTYTFVAKITDFAGRDFKKSGSILLLKKK
jgi:gliding motility-associated-like protein